MTLDAWQRLSGKHPLGKKTIVPFVYDAAGVNTKSAVSLLQLPGNDDAAQQISLLLSPPRLIPGSVTVPSGGSAQDLSGSVGNDDAGAGLAGTSVFVDLYAEIEWGVGGSSNRAIVDILNGLCVNLTASFIRVRAGAASINGDSGGAFYELSAFVGPGYPKNPNAQRTLWNAAWTMGESGVLVVPNFAKSVSVALDSGGANYTGTIEFAADRGFTFPCGSYKFDSAAPNSLQDLKLSNMAKYFKLTKTSGTPLVQVIFELAI